MFMGIFMPSAIDSMTPALINSNVAMSQANEANWKSIPGSKNVVMTQNVYVFNCTNPDDVIFKGLKPEYNQLGPYYYQILKDDVNISYSKSPDLFNPMDSSKD